MSFGKVHSCFAFLKCLLFCSNYRNPSGALKLSWMLLVHVISIAVDLPLA